MRDWHEPDNKTWKITIREFMDGTIEASVPINVGGVMTAACGEGKTAREACAVMFDRITAAEAYMNAPRRQPAVTDHGQATDHTHTRGDPAGRLWGARR